MTYELALKLKEAGFPQNGNGSILFPEGDWSKDNPLSKAWEVYFPTLSELIEECQKESVIVITTGESMTTVLHGVSGLVCRGSTPTEALASLWLSLKNK